MKIMVPLIAAGSLAGCSPATETATAPNPAAIAELRAAEAHLVADLEGDDPLAWVGDYTTDAVFQEGDGDPVSGRAALTEMARSMGPLSSVSIKPVRTEIQGNLAYVQVRGAYAVGRGPTAAPPSQFRGVMIWRKDADGKWRMLHEMLAPEKPTKQ
jgi:ketosteroid isomerase-like protein